MRRIFSTILFVTSVFFFFSCKSTKLEQTEKKEVSRPELLEQNPPQRPDWADSIPHSEENLYFVGLSNGIATEKEARSDAYQNVLNQVVKYYGELIKSQASEIKSVKALSSDVIDPYIESEEMIQRYAQAYVHEILPENYYTEHWLIGDKDEWKCWVKCSVSKQKIQSEIENFAKNISERYSSLLPENQKSKFNSTKSAIQAYLVVYEAVHKNPIYQAVAYVQTSAGKASLDEYAFQQAKRIIQNINIEEIDCLKKVEQGSDFKAIVRLISKDYEKITGMGAKITLSQGGKVIASTLLGTDDKNNIEVLVKTEKLKYGDYSVLIQLYTDAYKELGEVYTSSSNINFSFGYIQAPVKIEYIKEKSAAQLSELGNEINTKIENLLQEKLTENEIPIKIADSSTSKSEFVLQIKSTELKTVKDAKKIRLTATLLFQKEGITLAKSSEITADGLSKSGMAAEMAFQQISEQLKENESFYKNLLNVVGAKR